MLVSAAEDFVLAMCAIRHGIKTLKSLQSLIKSPNFLRDFSEVGGGMWLLRS